MRTKARRRLVILLVVALGAAAVGSVVWLAGRASLQNWVGQQIIGIANSYLVPQLTCELVEYEAPYTVRLHRAKWTAPDGTNVFDVEQITITLAELPKKGEPIRIESVEIASGTINLVQKDDGGLRGLSPIVKVKPGQEHEAEDAIDEKLKLSNVLALRSLKLTNGVIRFEPAGDDPTMVLKDLSLDLDIEPTADGAYRLVLDTGPRPRGRIQADATLNLDTMHLRLNSAGITIDVDDESISTLPPPIQTLLKEHDAAGHLEIAAGGELHLLDPTNADMVVVVDLTDFNVAFGDLHLPIESMHINVKFADQMLDLAGFNAELLDGKITAIGRLDLDSTRGLSELSWYLSQLDLELLLRSDDKEQESKIAGRLSGGGEVSLDPADLPGSLSGNGDFLVEDGTLVMLPGLTELAELMNAAIGGDAGKNQSANVEYRITPTSIEIVHSELQTDTLLVRGEGRINYNGTLQINARGGPVERFTKLFGKVGQAIGSITEKGATYKIRGTLAEPDLSIAPLGIGAEIGDEIPEAPSKEPGDSTPEPPADGG